MELDTSETTMSNSNNNNNNSSNNGNNSNNNNNGNMSNNSINTVTMANNANNNSSLADGGDTNAVTQNGNSSNGLNSASLFKSNFDTDVLRLIGQHLASLGYKQTVDQLLKESGLCGLDHPVASKFQQHIIAGEWDRASALVDQVVSYSEGDKRSHANQIRLLLAEQKFLELIEDNHHIKALKCLRLEITPLTDDIKRVQHLATLLLSRNIDEVRERANWLGKGVQSRQALIEKFQHLIPPIIMLPPKRLSTLLSQAVQLQCDRCALHIPQPMDDYVDLKSDHVCSADKFPLQSKQELDRHRTEIWYCKFSNDGTMLATGGLGGRVRIWNVDPIDQELTERCLLDCNCFSITCLSWSPNDVFLLVCGSDESSEMWVWNVLKEEIHNTIPHSDDESNTTCSWHMEGDKFAAASIKGNFNIYGLDGNRRGCREGVRVQCLAFPHKDPTCILAADHLNRIKSYSILDMSLETEEDDILEERHSIISFVIDRNDKYIAVNLVDQGVHLWDYKLKTLLRMFPGVCQRNFTIYSSFSSPDSTFLASGSEDGKVYIYHIHKDRPVAILHGHSRCVNCVSWNPKYPELLVSVSDDRVVRLWAPTKAN